MIQTLNALPVSIFTSFLMLVVNSILYYSEPDKRHRHTLGFWFCYFFYFLYSHLTQNATQPLIALSTLFWIWRTRSIARILADVGGTEVRQPWHYYVIPLSYLGGFLGYYFGLDFTYYTLIPAVGNLIVGFSLIKRTRDSLLRRGNVGPIHNLLLLSVLLIFLHSINYSIFRPNPHWAGIGYVVALIPIMLMAVILPSVAIYELQRDQQEALEKVIREKVKQLTDQAKFSALGEMTAEIVHEIKSPLSIVLQRSSFLSQLLRKDKFEKETFVRNLEQIEVTTERMSKIVNSLRKFSRNSDKEIAQLVQVGSIIEDTLVYCKDRFYHANIPLEIGKVPACEIECKSVQLSQVLLNLLNNSFEAVKKSQDAWVRISFTEGTKVLSIKVIDSGLGIPLQVRRKIMEPFFTTKAEGGTGLGLSISKEIMESHHGKLYYDEASAHTTFVLEIPYRQS